MNTGRGRQESFFKACLSIDVTPDMLRHLIAAGADVNAAIQGGYTPLHAAAMADWDEDDDGRMRVLLEHRANPEARADTQGGRQWTPLLLAAAEGHAAQVRTLVAWGGNVNAQDSDGRTALMLAVSQLAAPEAKTQTLISAGADPSKKCLAGKTALDNAREYLATLQSVGSTDIQGVSDDLAASVAHASTDSQHSPPSIDVNLAAALPHQIAEYQRVVGFLEAHCR